MSKTPSAFERGPHASVRYSQLDPEARLGLSPGHGTSPSASSTLLLAGLLLVIIYLPAFLFRNTTAGETVWTALTGYQRIPIAIAATSCWAAAILIIKSLKIRGQRQILRAALVPDAPEFRIDGQTVSDVLARLPEQLDDPSRFLLADRIDRVLRNVRNVGRVADIEEMFASAAESDESRMESSYTILRGLVWAIPVLGFIGTILGLTMAIGEFQGVLDASGADEATLVRELGEVIGGLETAFVTTGEGLVAALVLQLGVVLCRRGDESLLDDIRDYCTVRILSLVRISRVD